MRIGYAHVTSTLALVVALSGTAYAATTITSANIKNNTIQSKDIKNHAIKSTDLAAKAKAEIRGQAGQILTTRPADLVLTGTKTVLKLDLPAGSWAIVAHVGGAHNGAAFSSRLECLLAQPGGELDFAKLRLAANTGLDPLVFADESLNGAVTLASPGSVTVACSNVTFGDPTHTITLTGLAMTAISGTSVALQ
jgi:hypothetical protein